MLFHKIATVNISFGSVSSGCDGTFDNVQHTINTPNYPSYYGINELCHWRIEASPGVKIQLQFETFITESISYDYLMIYDGSSENSTILGRFGGSSPSTPKVSTGSQMYLVWRSDETTTRNGFKIKVIPFRKYNHIKSGAYQNIGNFQRRATFYLRKFVQVFDFFSGSCNSFFHDRYGNSCLDYINERYCTSNGEFGARWGGKPFETYANSLGETAWVCRECGCGRTEVNEQGNLTIFGISL